MKVSALAKAWEKVNFSILITSVLTMTCAQNYISLVMSKSPAELIPVWLQGRYFNIRCNITSIAAILLLILQYQQVRDWNIMCNSCTVGELMPAQLRVRMWRKKKSWVEQGWTSSFFSLQILQYQMKYCQFIFSQVWYCNISWNIAICYFARYDIAISGELMQDCLHYHLDCN